MYDVSLIGSTVQSGRTLDEAYDMAKTISETFAGRLIRVHDVDGQTVLAEYRNGQALIALLS